jgi:hypothetical protein
MVTIEQKTSGGLLDGYDEIGDVRLHYIEAGERPLIVVLSGSHDASSTSLPPPRPSTGEPRRSSGAIETNRSWDRSWS